jgi:hypothetical protein
MYPEGGPKASLYVKHEDIEAEHVGSYETDFNENDDNNKILVTPEYYRREEEMNNEAEKQFKNEIVIIKLKLGSNFPRLG